MTMYIVYLWIGDDGMNVTRVPTTQIEFTSKVAYVHFVAAARLAVNVQRIQIAELSATIFCRPIYDWSK